MSRRPHQRRRLAAATGVRAAAGVDQRRRELERAARGGIAERAVARAVARVGAGALLQQGEADLLIRREGGLAQRRLALAVGGVHRRARLQQPARYGAAPGMDGEHQRRRAVRVGEIELALFVGQQRLDHGRAAGAGGDPERGVAFAVAREPRGAGGEQPRQRLRAARAGGLEQEGVDFQRGGIAGEALVERGVELAAGRRRRRGTGEDEREEKRRRPHMPASTRAISATSSGE